MTRWNRLPRPLALLVIGALATSAVAQPAPAPKKQPTQQELGRARAHFKAAEAAKARRDYKTAAAEYLAAYELFADPEFFYDVGEVYRLAGDEPSALTYYQKYLALEPNGRGAPAARTAVDELRSSIAARQDATKRAADDQAKRKAADEVRRKSDEDAAKRAVADEAKRKADEVRRKSDEDAAKRAVGDEAKRKADEESRRTAAEDAAKRAAGDQAKRQQPATPPETPPAAPAPAVRAWYRDPVTFGLLGTGVVATGVGTGLLLSAEALGQKAKDASVYTDAQNLKDRGISRRNLGLITGGVGVALMAGGVTWIFLHRDSYEQRTVTAWLAPGGGGGLAITGPF